MTDALCSGHGTQVMALVSAIVAREANLLDDRDWQNWLGMYTEDCEYWVPTWVDEDTLASDPRSQLSHIYYCGKAGLEDRVMRITGGRSAASEPRRRTSHQLSNHQIIEADDASIELRCAFCCHSYDPHTTRTDVFFGHVHYLIVNRNGEWLIGRKKIVLLNDTLPAAVDIYSL